MNSETALKDATEARKFFRLQPRTAFSETGNIEFEHGMKPAGFPLSRNDESKRKCQDPRRSERPHTAKGRRSVGSGPLTRPLATLSPQTGEGVLEFDRILNFVGSK